MNTTHEISPIRQHPFQAGFWLIIAIPVTLMILFLILDILKIPDGDLKDRISFSIMFTVHFGAGFLWARSLGHRSGLSENRMMNAFAGLAVSLSMTGVEFGLIHLEPIIDPWLALFNGAGNLEFGALFAPWTGLVCGISGFALGIGLQDLKLSLKLLALGFITGLGLYLAIMFTMQLFGFKVSSGRPVMLPTTFLSLWVTALVGSELFGRMLEKSKTDKEK
jgi:hypothetical protein